MDLSFHKVKSVNNGICKDEYLDDKLDLGFPKVDEYLEFIKSKRKYCLVFKKDLRQAYRPICICPSDHNLVSFVWGKHIFCDLHATIF